MKQNKVINIIGLLAIAILIYFAFIKGHNFKVECDTNMTTGQIENLTPGQLFDTQLCFEGKIKVLDTAKKRVQGIRDEKTASVRGQSTGEQVTTEQVEQTPSEQLDSGLGL